APGAALLARRGVVATSFGCWSRPGSRSDFGKHTIAQLATRRSGRTGSTTVAHAGGRSATPRTSRDALAVAPWAWHPTMRCWLPYCQRHSSDTVPTMARPTHARHPALFHFAAAISLAALAALALWLALSRQANAVHGAGCWLVA